MFDYIFEVGATYKTRDPLDHACTWIFKVVSRTARTVTVQENGGKELKLRVVRSAFGESEAVYPFGCFHMAPALRASGKC